MTDCRLYTQLSQETVYEFIHRPEINGGTKIIIDRPLKYLSHFRLLTQVLAFGLGSTNYFKKVEVLPPQNANSKSPTSDIEHYLTELCVAKDILEDVINNPNNTERVKDQNNLKKICKMITDLNKAKQNIETNAKTPNETTHHKENSITLEKKEIRTNPITSKEQSAHKGPIPSPLKKIRRFKNYVPSTRVPEFATVFNKCASLQKECIEDTSLIKEQSLLSTPH